MEKSTAASQATSSEAQKKAKEATAPAVRKQYRNVVVSAWPKTVTTADGKQRETWVCSVTREYRDGDQRKRTPYLFPEDLLFASHALAGMFDEFRHANRNEEQTDA